MNYKVSVAVDIGIGSKGVKMIDISEIRQGFAVFFKIGLVYNNGGKNGLFFGAPFAFTYGIGAVDSFTVRRSKPPFGRRTSVTRS